MGLLLVQASRNIGDRENRTLHLRQLMMNVMLVWIVKVRILDSEVAFGLDCCN